MSTVKHSQGRKKKKSFEEEEVEEEKKERIESLFISFGNLTKSFKQRHQRESDSVKRLKLMTELHCN